MGSLYSITKVCTGIAVSGGLLDGGHVPDAGQRHVQRPGNGRSGERQHVHALGKLLQPLLMGDAEALLLVHDEQAQILELDGSFAAAYGCPMTKIHGAGAASFWKVCCCCFGVRKRLSTSMVTGKPRKRATAV